MNRLLIILFALFPSIAFSQPFGAGYPSEFVAAIQDEGYRATLGTDNVGDPKISSSVGGSNFSIMFYGCSENTDCKDIQFSIGFNKSDALSASAMNEWNRTQAVGTAYVDSEGDPFLQLFIPGATELSKNQLSRILARWDSALGHFKDHIDWN